MRANRLHYGKPMPDFTPQNPKQLWQLPFQNRNEGSWPMAVSFLGSDRRIAAGDRDGRLLVWDLPEPGEAPPLEQQQKTPGTAPAPKQSLVGHTNGITRLATIPDGKTLISASFDRTIRLWDVAAAPSGSAEVVVDHELRDAEAKRSGKKPPAETPGTKVETVTAVHTLEGHKDWIDSLSLSADGRCLLTGDQSSLVIAWDVAASKECTRWSGHPWNWIVATALTADGETAVVSEYRYKRDDFDIPCPALKRFHVAEGVEQLDLLKVQFPKLDPKETTYGSAQVWRKFVAQGLVALDISPDGKLLAAAQGGETDTGQVHLLEMETGKLVKSISGHQYGATDLKFTADGKHLISAGRDTVIRICQVEDGNEVAQLGKPRGGQFKDWITSIALSPDQRTLAATDIGGWVHVWTFEG